jgi:hypothetical protein
MFLVEKRLKSRILRSTTDHIFWICQIPEEKWEYNEAVASAVYRLQESL